MKDIQKNILEYLSGERNEEESYQNLINFLNDQKIRENKHELKSVLHFILNVSNNYHRNSGFFNKIDKMIRSFQEEMKNNFSNYEIFNIFKSNKRVLLFLFEEKIIVPDISIAYTIIKKKYKNASYHYYFFPEFKAFYDVNLLTEMFEVNKTLFQNQEIADIQKFKQNRKIGENEEEICHIIREDMLDEFMDYTRNNKLAYSSIIDSSIFETNPFLINKNPSLIEYAAFFGSGKIFKFLYLNVAKLNPPLWMYSIHGKDTEIIRVLKDKYVKPEDKTYHEILFEAIKCHHNDISKNFLKSKKLQDTNINTQSHKYYNFEFFPTEINTDDYIFFDFCKYDYFLVADFLLKTINIDINDIRILKNNVFLFNFLLII